VVILIHLLCALA